MAGPILTSINSDTGTSSGDRITRDTSLSFSGTAHAFGFVEIFVNGESVAFGQADIDGYWTINLASQYGEFAEGQYAIQILSTSGSNSSFSETYQLVVDLTPPAAPTLDSISDDTGISATDGITNDTTLTLTGTAEANAIVTIYDFGTEVGSALSDSSGNWTYATGNLGGDQGYSFSASQADLAGNSGPRSSEKPIYIDTTADAPAFDQISQDSGALWNDRVTNDNTPIVWGTGEAGATVTILEGATIVGTALVGSNGYWQYHSPELADGVHTFTYFQTDRVGNVSATSGVAVTIDTTPPTAPTFDGTIADDTGTSSTDLLTNDRTVTLEGDCDPSAFALRFYDGENLLAVRFTGGGSRWGFTTDELTEGVHSITVVALDFAGNELSSAAFNVTIDTTGPSAPVISGFSDDTGASDGVTNDTSLTITGGAAVPGGIVVVTDSLAGIIGSAVADQDGNWSVSYATFAEGSHSLTATSTDLAGNTGAASSPFVIAVDTTADAPVFDSIAPDDGFQWNDEVTNSNIPTLYGAGESGATVTILDGSTVVGTAFVYSWGGWSFDTPELTDGVHTFTFFQTDRAGNVSSVSGPTLVTIDTVAPTAPTIDAQIADDTGTSSTDGITNDRTVYFEGDCDPSTFQLYFYDGETVLGVHFTGGVAARWGFETGELSEGVHSFRVLASDAAGNLSTFAVRDFTIDTTAPDAPVITGFSDDNGAYPNDGITSDTSIIVNGTAEAGSVVTLTDSLFGTLGTALADQNGNWSGSYTFTEGGHSLTATATDAAGNAGAASSPYVIVVDVTAPSAPTIDDFSGNTGYVLDNVTKNTVITLIGSAETTGVTVKVYDGNTFLGTASVNGFGEWRFTASTLTEGTHEFHVTATDYAGNESVESSEFSVEIDITGPTTAVTSINKPGLGSFDTGTSFTDEVTRDRTLILSGTTSETMSTVTVFRDGVPIGTASSDSNGDWSFDYTGTILTDGTYNFTAQATDIAGNTGAVSVALPVTIDNVAPTAAVPVGITDDGGLRPLDRVTSDNTVAIHGTAEVGSTVEVYLDNVSIGTATADSDGKWTFDHTATTLADGDHHVVARVTDAAGNSKIGTTPLTFTVDTTAPSAPVIGSIADDTGRLSTDEITNDTTLTVSGTTEADAMVTIIDASNGNAVIGTALADGSGAWSVGIATLTEGTHNLRAFTTDVAGNVGPQTADFPVVIDLTLPTAPSITSFDSDTGISNTDGITNDEFGYTVSGTADAGSIVRVYFDGGISGDPSWTALADSNGDWSWYFNGGIGFEGPRDFVATATDVAGNTSGFGPGYTVTFDYTPPAAAVISGVTEDGGSSTTDGITSDTTLTINGTSEALAIITLSEGTLGSLGSTQADASGNWSYAVSTPFAEGDYAFTAAIQDRAGNAGAGYAAFNVTVDTTAPTTPAITSFSPDTAYIVPGGFPDLGASFSDGVTKSSVIVLNGTGDIGAIITIYDDATALGTALVDVNGNWTFQTDPLPDGDHSFTAKASDAAGNESGATPTATEVLIDTVNPTRPTVTGVMDDTGSSSTDGITSDTRLIIHGTGEAGTAIWLTSFQLPVGANVIGGGLGTALVDSNGEWSIDLSGLMVYGPGGTPVPFVMTDRSFAVFAEALDDAGNSSGFGNQFWVTVDTTPPAPAVVASFADDTGVQGDSITNDNTVTLTGTGDVGSIVMIIDAAHGNALLGTATVDGSGNWSFTTDPLSDGLYQIAPRAADLAGNIVGNVSMLSFTVDTAPPAAPTILYVGDDTAAPSDGITSDTVLVIDGSAEAGSTVTVYDGETLVGTALADGFGQWSVTTGTLPDGDHSFTATATDPAGNTGVASAAWDMTVDTTAPAAPVFTGITDDTGASGSDAITQDRTLVLNGTAEAGSYIVLTEAGTGYVGSALTDSNGNWSFNYAGTTLADGGYAFSAYATDAAGNSSDVAPLFVVHVDNSAPAVPTITGYSDDTGVPGDSLTNDSNLTFTGVAEADSLVTLMDGATVVGTQQLTGGATTWSITTSTLSNSVHSITAIATDAAGNTGPESSAFVVTVDAVAPHAPPDVVYGPNAVTGDNTPQVYGEGAEYNSKILIYDGETLIGSTMANGIGDWSFTSGVLADGPHSLMMRSEDAAGNISAASNPVNFTIDTVAPATPAIVGFSDDGGLRPLDRVTSDNTPTIHGTAEAGAFVEISRGSSFFTVQVDNSGNWSFADTTLADGDYGYMAWAYDGAGNRSDASELFVVTIDTAPPAAPVITSFSDDSGVGGDFVTNDTTLTISGTAEADSVVTILDGAVAIGTALTNSSGSWTFATATLQANAAHSFTATATDVAGNTGSASAATVVTIDTTAAVTINPTIGGDTGSSATDLITKSTTVTLSGTAEANSLVVIKDGTTVVATQQLTGGATVWSVVVSSASGEHSYTATATDPAGNSATTTALSVTVDTTPPGAPVISSVTTDTGLSSTDEVTSDTTPTLNGTAEAGATIEVFRDGNLVGSTTANGSGNWSFTDTTLADAAYSYTAKATDLAGNTSSSSSTLVVAVDTTNPATPVDSDAAANTIAEDVVNGSVVGITASSTDFSGTRYSLTNDAGGRFTIDVNTGVVAVADASLISFEAATSHSITVQATDFAGNVSTQTFAVDVTNIAPTVPVDNDGAAGGRVSDKAGNGTAAGITALSSDIHGGAITYSLTDDAGGRFTIDASTGVVTVADASLLDRTANPSHTITVQATDGSLTSTTNFTIAVTNSGVTINGTAGNNTVNATKTVAGQPLPTADDDIINGFGGNDNLSGLNGDDTIDGGIGADTMTGGAGNDTYFVDHAKDVVVEKTGGGVDQVFATVSYKMANHVENLTLTGTSNINGNGNGIDNVIIGNSGANKLNGGGGNDRLDGGAGNDTLTGGGGFDTFVFNGNFGNDTVVGFVGNGAAAGDTIEFDSSLFADFAAVLEATTDQGNNLLITHANGTVLLKGVKDPSLLHASDFTFV